MILDPSSEVGALDDPALQTVTTVHNVDSDELSFKLILKIFSVIVLISSRK